jgi:hypothetical protein
MAPFLAIILCSIVVLSVWTAIDPLVWIREPISGFDDEDEPLETYGRCKCENGGIIPFLVVLGLLLALVIVLTMNYSWKLKEVSSDFSDSKLIFFGIFTHIQLWLIGIPILVITNAVSKDAFYLMMAVLAFIFSLSLVCSVIWPKLYFYIRDTYFEGNSRPSAMSSIGVNRGNTRVSGVHVKPETSRTVELESQVSKLKLRLEEKESEINKMSLRLSNSARLSAETARSYERKLSPGEEAS